MSLTAQHSFVANGGDLLSSYQPPLLNPATSVSYGYTLDEFLSYTSVQGMSNGPSYTHDAGGRLSTVSYAHPVGGAVTVTNTYGKLGNQTAVGHLLQSSATNGGYGRTAALNYSYDGAMKTSEQYAGPINGGANTGIWPNNSTHSVDYPRLQRSTCCAGRLRAYKTARITAPREQPAGERKGCAQSDWVLASASAGFTSRHHFQLVKMTG